MTPSPSKSPLRSFRALRSLANGLMILAAAAGISACTTVRKKVAYVPPPPLPSYHDLREGIPFRRVVMLPLYFERETNAGPGNLDASFHSELAKTTLFEVVWINRLQLEALTGKKQVSSVEALPGGVLTQLGAQYGADAVLFTDVTHYFPYQPISMGVRCKLVDLRSGEIRWGFDHLFDSGKPAVAVAARHYYLCNSQTNLPIANDGNSVLQSPSRFAGYAAWETYRSLINKPVPVVCSSAIPAK